jgi:hypothetical protein
MNSTFYHSRKLRNNFLKDGSAAKSVKECFLTLGPHAYAEALLEPTLLAFPSHVHINLAVVTIFALVYCILRYASPEKP